MLENKLDNEDQHFELFLNIFPLKKTFRKMLQLRIASGKIGSLSFPPLEYPTCWVQPAKRSLSFYWTRSNTVKSNPVPENR